MWRPGRSSLARPAPAEQAHFAWVRLPPVEACPLLTCVPMSVGRVRAAFALAGILLCACQGQVDGAGSGPDSEMPPAPDAELPSPPACQTVDPGPAFIRRLTRFEYNNTVRDLLGDTTQPGLY